MCVCVCVRLQRGENVQIVVIYFNRFFVNPKRWDRSIRYSIDEYAGGSLTCDRDVEGKGVASEGGLESPARDNAPMCGQVRTTEPGEPQRRLHQFVPRWSMEQDWRCGCEHQLLGDGGRYGAKVNVNRFNQAKDKCGDSGQKS